MQRISMIEPANAQGRTKELFATVEQAFGMIPNATKVMANSPAVLESFLVLSTAMSKTKIGDKLHTQAKLTTSESNGCNYCTSVLCAVGSNAGLTAADLLAGRTTKTKDVRTEAALTFAKQVMETKGKVSDEALRQVRQAGFDDAEIVELVASVVLGCFTNFLNNVAETTLDIPAAAPLTQAA